ncbi:unnamed protein product [Linum tenue]|uniref:F-box/LRR-repeat protein 15/At3g58940/PEG3-like LRR domain-containing protein n=1 Tax=Linum tenue TaxID=586396 RepID=A0AAV0IJ62_9ROSI|nr:unnamed protein product [Linum tenue]
MDYGRDESGRLGDGRHGGNKDAERTERQLSYARRCPYHKDAARTAILSSTWRRHWRSIPQLVFHDDGFATRRFDGSRIAPNKLILNIYKSLLVHEGPIAKFVLAVPGMTPCNEIDHIVLHLCSRGVQELTLVFSREAIVNLYYKLPSSLFSSTAALHLNRLKLGCCLFSEPPWFVGFSKVTDLELCRVSLQADFFENFLPKCPLLQYLVMDNCSGIEKLELDAPRLKMFSFAGDYQLQEFCFKSAPLLVVLILNLDVVQKVNQLVASFASLPALQNLCLLSDPINFLLISRPRALFDSFEMERLLVCLIMSSPNLQTLIIRREVSPLLEDRPADSLATGIGRLLEEEEHHSGGGPPPCLQQLREFAIEGGLGAPLDLELARFVLATAPQLVKIQIRPSRLLCYDDVTKFMKEVMRCKRVSSEVRVVYAWDGEQD